MGTKLQLSSIKYYINLKDYVPLAMHINMWKLQRDPDIEGNTNNSLEGTNHVYTLRVFNV